MTLAPTPQPAIQHAPLRRAFDILAALAGGLVLLPVMLIIAIVLRIDIGSPILFRQIRAGRGGKVFSLVKFRTMTDARDASGALLPDSARTTRFGSILRRVRLDETPEFWNVLAGHMSIVGPRPLLPVTVASFGEAGIRRGALRPGLTGWSQVNGGAELTNIDKLALDLWYIDHRSAALDAQIILKTPLVFVKGETFGRENIQSANDYARPRYRLG